MTEEEWPKITSKDVVQMMSSTVEFRIVDFMNRIDKLVKLNTETVSLFEKLIKEFDGRLLALEEKDKQD